MENAMIGQHDIKKAVSACIAAKAGGDTGRQAEAMRRLINGSVVFLESGGSIEELDNLASGKK